MLPTHSSPPLPVFWFWYLLWLCSFWLRETSIPCIPSCLEASRFRQMPGGQRAYRSECFLVAKHANCEPEFLLCESDGLVTSLLQPFLFDCAIRGYGKTKLCRSQWREPHTVRKHADTAPVLHLGAITLFVSYHKLILKILMYWDYIISPSPFPPSKSPFAVFQIRGLSFHSLYIYIYVPKYKNTTRSVYVTCMYVFRADHLVLDNQLVCSSQGKTISFCSQRSLVTCLLCRVEAWWPFPPSR